MTAQEIEQEHSTKTADKNLKKRQKLQTQTKIKYLYFKMSRN